MRKFCVLMLFLLPDAADAQSATRARIDEVLLGFEVAPVDGRPGGWVGGPKDTLFSDSAEKHGGERSLRMERTATSADTFSYVFQGVPVDF